MELEILCEVPFVDDEERDLDTAASTLGITKEELVRSAVKAFVAECVPTHNAAVDAA